MQRLVALSAFLVAAVPALAHPVHVAEEAGHTHWLGIAAVGGAIVIAIVGLVRGALSRRRETSAQTK